MTTFHKLKSASLASALLVFSLSAAQAGGFSRNEADTDLLYEEGKVVFRIGGAYVMPTKAYDTLNGKPALDRTVYSQNYFMPGVGLKFQLGASAGCALTYNQPFGGAAAYTKETQGVQKAIGANPTITNTFIAQEFGGTCNYKVKAGPGNLHFIGGIFVQTFNYTEETGLGTLRLNDDGKVGFRAGLAYDIPQYAMRAELMYRSQINHSVAGNFSLTPAGQFVLKAPVALLPATGSGTLPQSVKLSLQSGIAPNWLAYGSIKWTNWAVLNTLNYNIVGVGPQAKRFNYKDGLTVQVGIGHKFNDMFSGTFNVTWDQGVGRMADIATDTWTFGTGVSMKTNYGTFGVGGALSLLKGGAQMANIKGPSFNATAKDSWAGTLGVSYMVKY